MKTFDWSSAEGAERVSPTSKVPTGKAFCLIQSTACITSEEVPDCAIHMSLDKRTYWSKRCWEEWKGQYRYGVPDSASCVRLTTAYRHCSWFDGIKVVWFRCDENMVQCNLLQHDLSHSSRNNVGGAVIYFFCYSLCRIVWNSVWRTRILWSPLMPQYCGEV